MFKKMICVENVFAILPLKNVSIKGHMLFILGQLNVCIFVRVDLLLTIFL